MIIIDPNPDGNGLAIRHGFTGITQIKGQQWQQVAHFEFDKVEIFRAYPSLKPPSLFYSNGILKI